MTGIEMLETPVLVVLIIAVIVAVLWWLYRRLTAAPVREQSYASLPRVLRSHIINGTLIRH